MTHPGTLHLTKLHGLGNDFLVWIVDGPADDAMSGELARRVCARHHGIGADGLLTASPSAGDADWIMTLHNADGSRAEMSGNGIRCFAHAVVRANGLAVPAALRISTDVGPRLVQVGSSESGPCEVIATVDMGTAGDGPPIPISGRPATRKINRSGTADLGNPHLVLLVDDPADVDLVLEGSAWESLFAAGMNVHFVTVRDRTTLDMTIWERGAGVTEACGTGACAAAHLTHEWGLVDKHVAVSMPGGTVEVDLGDRIVLTGPSQWIADIDVLA